MRRGNLKKLAMLERLWEGEYCSIVNPTEYGYEVLHEPDVVYVLPVKCPSRGILTYGFRVEVCPPYLVKPNNFTGDKAFTILSGKIEPGEAPEAAALRELREESGVIPVEYELVQIMDQSYVCKSTDMRCFVYVVFLKKYDQEVPKGDGTEMEKLAKTEWMAGWNMPELMAQPNTDFLLRSVWALYLQAYPQYAPPPNAR